MPFESSVRVPIYPDQTVPKQYELDLYFLEHYEQKGLLSYIQDVRSRAVMNRRVQWGREVAQKSFEHERVYWVRLADLCAKMVDQIRSQGGEFDVIADPPSNTGYHRPYLAAIQQAFPDAAYCYCVKDRKLEAGTGELQFADLESGTELRHRKDDALDQRRSILIVDDIFSNGLTASVVIHKLRPCVHPDARFTLACPLRLPAKNEAAEFQQIIESMKD